MADWLLAHQISLRLGTFAGVFAAMAAWEALAPRRERALGRAARWPGNLGIVAIDAALLRFVAPMSAVAFAEFAAARGWGLLPALGLPGLATTLAAVALLDAAIWAQHVVFHRVPALWRLHRMHHADVEFDVINGLRFHPLEMVLSMAVKLAVIAAVGAPPVAVLAFEVVLNSAAMFNHGNVTLPLRLDRVLRWMIVTPDMHRVHHSSLPEETHSNFGFNLPWWDRCFGTYVAQPRDGHTGMQLGLPMFREPRWLRLDRMLVQPWVGPVGLYRGSRRAVPTAAKQLGQR